MDIGIIGSGEMGICLATKFIKLGHRVSIANTRGPASLKQLAEDIGAEPASVEDATKNKQVIIIAIPQKNIPHLPKDLFKALPDDVVVIETGNYYPNLRDGVIPELVESGIDSLWVQEQLGRPVVKAFNSILATSVKDLGKPAGDKDRVAMSISGDSLHAKAVVAKLVDELGFDSYDLGDITRSWQQQPGSPIYCRDINRAEIKKRLDLIETDWSKMQDIIIANRLANEALMKTDYPAYLEYLRA
ncbi:MAG: NADPH-dependent F420 reductase [Mucilaginibacter sp.]